VTLVIDAGDIRCPELLVWAGFMARTDRIKVPVDADVRSGLSTIDGPSMNEERPRQWRPDSEGGPVKATLLEGNYQSHSGDISQTMRHLATAAQPAGSTSAPTLSARPPRLRARQPFPDMRPYDPAPMQDRAPVLRTMPHLNRRQPVTPEYMRESLRQIDPNAIGFSFTATRDAGGNFTGLDFAVVTSHAQLAALKSAATFAPPPQEMRLGSIFDDIWDDVKDAAESVYEAAQQLVITVGNTVTAAINAAGKWLETAIHDIKDAFIAIGNFLKQLALDVLKVIEFLLSFFDFAEIIAVANLLRTYLSGSLRQTAAYLRTIDLKSRLPELMTWFEAQAGLLAAGGVPIDSVGQSRQGASAGPAAASNSVDGKYAQSKLDEHGGRSDFSVGDAAADLPGEFLELAEGLGMAIVDFLAAVPSLPSMSLDDFRVLIAKVMKDVLTPLLKIVETLLEALLASLADILDLAAGTLDTEISIPFLSDLLKWLFPDLKLTYGLVATFAIAMPFQVIFRAASGRKFSEMAPASLPPLYEDRVALLGDADDAEWKKYAWASGAFGMAICQMIADAIRMVRADKMYPFGFTTKVPANPSPPPLPEYLANIGVAAFGSLNAWTTRNPTRWIQVTLQSVNGLKVLYNGYRSFKPGPGTFGLTDAVMPFLAMAAGIGTVAVGYSDATTGKAQAELWCWNVPQIYRPVTIFPWPPLIRGVIIVADVALFGAAGGLHLDQPAYSSTAPA
jgi:hypothetical protein